MGTSPTQVQLRGPGPWSWHADLKKKINILQKVIRLLWSMPNNGLDQHSSLNLSRNFKESFLNVVSTWSTHHPTALSFHASHNQYLASCWVSVCPRASIFSFILKANECLFIAATAPLLQKGKGPGAGSSIFMNR